MASVDKRFAVMGVSTIAVPLRKWASLPETPSALAATEADGPGALLRTNPGVRR